MRMSSWVALSLSLGVTPQAVSAPGREQVSIVLGVL